MSTSGTIGQTTISTYQVLEHAMRRAGKPVTQQTPEVVQIATECLFLFLTGLSSRGFNLWCVDKYYLGVVENQYVYTLPTGTIDLLNVVYSQGTQATGTDTTTSNSTTTALAAATPIVRVGVEFSAISSSDTVVIASSDDNSAFTTRLSSTKTNWTTGTWYWFALDPFAEAQYWKVSTTSASAASEFYLASSVYDLPVAIWNRDDYLAINNKYQTGRPATNYFFEKKVNPQITLWPVPNETAGANDQITVMVHRQVEDIGTLTQQLELPARWLDAMIWQLSGKLVFELPDVDPTRRTEVLDQAAQNLLQAEGDESDGAPIFLSPNISVYTR